MDSPPLYVVTHGELSAGHQIAQVAHALAEFSWERGEEFIHWHDSSNYFIALQVSSPVELAILCERARSRSLDVIEFREPDRDFELTAIAFVPHERVRRLLSNLPLAGKQFVSVTQSVMAPRDDDYSFDCEATLNAGASASPVSSAPQNNNQKGH